MSTSPAGWFGDPGGSGRRRYWDGAAWTDHYEPHTPPPGAPPSPPPGVLSAPLDDEAGEAGRGRMLVVAGLITSAASLVLCPIFGSFAGAAVTVAGQQRTPTSRRSSLGSLPLISYVVAALGILGWGTALAISADTTPAEQGAGTELTTDTTPVAARPKTTEVSAPAPPVTIAVPTDSGQLLAALRIAPEDDHGAYDRDVFDYPSGGTDSRGCNTRALVLQRDSTLPAQVAHPGCKVAAGRWVDSYTGATYENPDEVSIDHLVPLKEAYRSGASSWSSATSVAFGNDVERVEALKVIGGSGNASKGDKDPARWKPPLQSAWPDYARAWLSVKVAYGLNADQAEADALRTMLIPPPPPVTVPPVAVPALAPPPPVTAAPTTRRPVTTRQVVTTLAPAPATSSCHPSYTGACLPPNGPDVDCRSGRGDGPVYTDRVQVVGPDEYDLDRDRNGIGCE